MPSAPSLSTTPSSLSSSTADLDRSAHPLLAWPGRCFGTRDCGKDANERSKNLPRPAKREPIMTPSPVVLVVDDVEDSRELYVQYLSFVGYRLFSAANGLLASGSPLFTNPAWA